MISWLIVLIRIFRFSISCDTEDSNHTNCKHCLTPDPRLDWPGSLVFCKNKHKLFINHASSPVGGFGLDFDDRLILLRQIVCLCIQITVVAVIIRKYQIKTFCSRFCLRERVSFFRWSKVNYNRRFSFPQKMNKGSNWGNTHYREPISLRVRKSIFAGDSEHKSCTIQIYDFCRNFFFRVVISDSRVHNFFSSNKKLKHKYYTSAFTSRPIL